MAHRPPPAEGPESPPHRERRHPGILGSLIGGVATGVGGVLQGAGQIIGGTLHGVGELVETVAGAGRRPHHNHPQGPPPPSYGPPSHGVPPGHGGPPGPPPFSEQPSYVGPPRALPIYEPPNHGGPPGPPGPPLYGYPPCNHWRSTDGCDSCYGWKWA